jgi:hypothetical protein
MSSHDSGANGVVFTESQDDGTNFDTISSQTYSAANGLVTFDFLSSGWASKDYLHKQR